MRHRRDLVNPLDIPFVVWPSTPLTGRAALVYSEAMTTNRTAPMTPYISPTCDHCGKPIKSGRVPLELDQRIGEYHDFGNVPADMSQGWFDFGPDCAKKLRARAKSALAKFSADEA